MTFARQQATAKKLIEKYGGPAKLVVFVTTEPAHPWETTGVVTELSKDVLAVFLSYKQGFENNTEVQSGDQRVLIAAVGLPFDPNMKGKLLRVLPDKSTETWSIVNVFPLNVNNEKILFTLQVRQ
jgi:hypothetical protein